MIDPYDERAAAELVFTSSKFCDVRLSTRSMPAESGEFTGDWCEAFAVSEHVMALSVGDICGHGAEKYDAMVAMRALIHETATLGEDPVGTLFEANRFLRRYDLDELATAIFGLFDVRTRMLTFANAGHPPPILATNTAARFIEFSDAALPLGVRDEWSGSMRSIRITDASLLVIYTDGVSERKRTPLRGEEDLLNAAVFSHHFPTLPSATVIGTRLSLLGSNLDNAAILTVRTP